MAEKKSPVQKIKHDQAMGARRTVIEELFNDYYKDRVNVYKVNFLRGIFFGLGSVLGATVLVALAIWLLSLFVDLPVIGDAVQQTQDSLESRQKK